MSDTKPIRVLAFSGEGVFSPVLDSQVMTPLRLLGEHHPDMRRALLVLTGIRHRKKATISKRIDEIRRSLPGIRFVHRFRPHSPIPFQHRIWARLLAAAATECGYDGPEPILIHCRGEATTAAATVLRRRDHRVRILLDLRGAAEDEARHSGILSAYRMRHQRRSSELAFAGADALNTVSNQLYEFARRTGRLRRDIPHCVLSCCADPARFYFDSTLRQRRRKELNIADGFVMVYCGSMARHQRFDATAEALSAIVHATPDAQVLVVTRDQQAALDHLRHANVPKEKITVRSASHDTVASYLMAGDVGLLLRESTLTNRVASPVKFAEYLRCGLPVVATNNIGDTSDFLERTGVGKSIPWPVEPAAVVEAVRNLRDQLKGEGDDFRRRCSATAGDHLSWEGQVEKLANLYARACVDSRVQSYEERNTISDSQ